MAELVYDKTYASTISYLTFCFLLPLLALHSTMLLLYPANNGASNEDKILYIPLCFYYIGYEKGILPGIQALHSTMLLLYRIASFKRAELACIFTFHYASTIS